MEPAKVILPRILVQGEANNFLGEDGVIYFSSTEGKYRVGDTVILGNKSGTTKTAIKIFDVKDNFYGGIVASGIIQDRLDLTHVHDVIER